MNSLLLSPEALFIFTFAELGNVRLEPMAFARSMAVKEASPLLSNSLALVAEMLNVRLRFTLGMLRNLLFSFWAE